MHVADVKLLCLALGTRVPTVAGAARLPDRPESEFSIIRFRWRYHAIMTRWARLAAKPVFKLKILS